jgi:hypothetical protein
MSHRRFVRGLAAAPARHRAAGRALPLPAALLALLGTVPAAAEAQDPLQALSGRWATGPGAPVAVELAPSDGGFTLTWRPPERDPTTARFAATERPNVYGAEEQQGWSMFSGGEPVNPLQEGTLLWARTADDGVYVYSLEIDDRGGFLLDRYAYRPSGEGVAMSLLRRTPEGAAEPPEQKLVRVDR